MLVIKKRQFYTATVNLYALIHIIITTGFALGFGKTGNSAYFAIDNTNLIFMIVLSFIFLMVAIYNNSYVKNFDTPDKRIRNYSFMILIFVLSMTGTILSTNLGLSWVLIEATTLSSAYLIYFNKTKHAIEAAWKYVFFCSIGIALAFVGIILLNISTGTINRLAKYGITDMYGIAHCSEDVLYNEFGINAELLIDHAWGREPCLIEDIKNYKGKSKSVSFSQVLPRDYTFEEARIVFSEMVLNGCQEMMRRHVITKKVGLFVGYTFGGQEPTGGTIRMTITTNLNSCIQPYAMDLFDRTTDKHTPIRRLGITFADVCDEGCEGYDLFTDFDAVKRERERERAVLGIMDKYGKNAVLRGTNHLDCGTQKERNTFIGGHRAGYDD